MCNRLQPHQLDCDWRFTATTANELANLAMQSRSLLLGCPSVAEALGSLGSTTTLVDRQPAVTCRFAGQVIQEDIRANPARLCEAGKFAFIVADSPWYPKDLLIWLSVALDRSVVGTTILFSIWPDETRPSARSEREAIFSHLSGRVTIERRPKALRYETPGFEHASDPEAPNEWRFGDLIILTVVKPGALPIEMPDLKHSWDRFAFDTEQIAVRVKAEDQEPPSIYPVFTSWYLPSVSKRQAGLDEVDIWTSANEVGGVTGGYRIRAALATLVKQNGDLSRVDDQLAQQVLETSHLLPVGPFSRSIQWMQFD